MNVKRYDNTDLRLLDDKAFRKVYINETDSNGAFSSFQEYESEPNYCYIDSHGILSDSYFLNKGSLLLWKAGLFNF